MIETTKQPLPGIELGMQIGRFSKRDLFTLRKKNQMVEALNALLATTIVRGSCDVITIQNKRFVFQVQQ